MSGLLKKFIFSILIGVTLFFSAAPFFQAKAQTSWYNQSFPEWYTKVYDSSNPNEIFGERYTAAQVQWIIYSIPSLLINTIMGGNTDLGSCFVSSTEGVIDIDICVQGMSNVIDKITQDLGITKNTEDQPSIASQIFADRPISGISYVRNIVNKLNPVSTIHAQSSTTGFGYTVLTILRPLWAITRNFAFFLFVIITIVFAFMIMFRVKLSPQVVIGVQTALPKLVMALILVTFSFAIAGFMIDLMYVLMGVFSTALLGAGSSTLGNVIRVGAAKYTFGFLNGSVAILKDGGIAIIVYFVAYLVLFFVQTVVVLVVSISGLHVSSIIFSLLLIVFTIILLLILIVNIFRVIFMLFKNLANVYGLIIVGPLQIASGALFPQSGFGSWIKKLFSKLLVFPLTGIFMYLSFLLLGYSFIASVYGSLCNNAIAGQLKAVVRLAMGLISQFTGIEFLDPANSVDYCNAWGPPMLGNPASASGIAFLLMSLGIIMMIPKIAQAIESFMAGKEFAGTGIGEALGPFGTLGKTVAGEASGSVTRWGANRIAGSASTGDQTAKGLMAYLEKNVDKKDTATYKLIQRAQEAISSFGSSKGR